MKERSFQDLFKEVFDTSAGRTILWWIADQCGYFATDPDLVRPDLLAFFNRLLAEGGIGPRKAGDLMKAITEVAAIPLREKEADRL